MIRFPFNGRECYANVYTHDSRLKEYHVHIIGSELHSELPAKIVLVAVDGQMHLADPLNLSKVVLQLVIERIRENQN
ncbi:MAG TPA: hypothetical protein VD993_08905 [Chitinophagaceae bacterium]|nr:hypothetical protein [Chitinophagaceae bacterium]